MTPPLVFRLRFLLRASKAIRLHAHHGPTIYALIAAALGRSTASAAGIPEDMWLDAPEQGRTSIRPNGTYAFGCTLLAASLEDARERLHQLESGLRDLGEFGVADGPKWGGNFQVDAIEDLVAGQWWESPARLMPIPAQAFDSETATLAGRAQLTLRFLSPLRCERGDRSKETGHGFFDRDHFDADSFLRRLTSRLERLGFLERGGLRPANLSLAANRLVWIDMSYGPTGRRKVTGGAVGRVTLSGITPDAARVLALGQYVRAGEGTKFGFGRYRIEELGAERAVCRRSASILELIQHGGNLARTAEAFGVPAAGLVAAVERLRRGDYRPAPAHRLKIARADGSPRQLAVPSRLDRALQRLILDAIAPGLDLFFEESSLAFRRGLGRERAAQEVRRAYRDGFVYALKSDLYHFFDTVEHSELKARLEAYLGDDEIVKAVMNWVAAAAPEPEHGLPTGSPLSPVLGNLLLDQFDEQIAAHGGRLVRYADDFLILTRSAEEASAMHERARLEAESLRLTLNEDKTAVLDLGESFHFLGYRFAALDEGWTIDAVPPEPGRLGDLGWEEASRDPPRANRLLPGETAEGEFGPDGTVILGPGLESLHRQQNYLIPVRPGEEIVDGIALESISELIMLGEPMIGPGVISGLAERNAVAVFADEAGRLLGAFHSTEGTADPDVIAAQVRAYQQPEFRLAVARRLTAAKLRNYAVVADAFPARGTDSTAAALRELADRCAECQNLDELRGREGAGAARWYGSLNARLPRGFSFSKRIAPEAADPVNVLLNIAQTHLFRIAGHAARAAGLLPGLGLFHERRAGFDALAADLQEPFRHLMDRVVLESLGWLLPSDFRPGNSARFPLAMRPRAARDFTAAIARQLAWPCKARDALEARPYRDQLVALVKSLRRCLLDSSATLTVLEHP